MAFLVAQFALGPGVVLAAAPTANVGGPYTGDEGTQIAFNGDGNDAEDATNQLVFEWDFDFDGVFTVSQSGVNLTNPTHTYPDDGVFSVALRVVDTSTTTSEVVETIATVANIPPSASAGGAYTVDEGSALTFSGSATDPGQDTLTYEWDFDYDGATFDVDSSGEDLTAPSNTYPNDGSETIAMRVRDEDGGVSSVRTTTVTVSNVPPVANAGSSYTGNEGAQVTFSGSATDPGSDTWNFEWDFNFSGGSFQIDASGDGLTAPDHTYVDDGVYTVALRVRDDDSVSPVQTADVTISNVLPTADANGPYAVADGTPVTFAGSATDPGDDQLTYEWDFEYDGATFTTGGPAADSGIDLTGPSHTYPNDGVFTAALRVRDDDDVSAIVTAQVTVLPQTASVPTSTISIPASASVVEDDTGTNNTVDIVVTMSIAGNAAVNVDYATTDGTATAGADYQAASGTLSIPAGNLTATVQVVVIGDDIGEGSESFTLTLSNATTTGTSTALFITQGTTTVDIVDNESVSTDIPLSPGYNLIAIPVSLSAIDTARDIAEALLPGGQPPTDANIQAGPVTAVLRWTGASYLPWLSSNPGTNDFSIVAGESYFVRLQTPVPGDKLTVSGVPYTASVQLDLQGGFNLVSVPFATPGSYDSMTLAEAIRAHAGAPDLENGPVLSILKWDGVYSAWLRDFPTNGIFNIETVRGYFLRMNQQVLGFQP